MERQPTGEMPVPGRWYDDPGNFEVASRADR